MSSYEELINELSELCGIIPEYWDIFGNKHTISIETQKAVLKVMRLNIDSEESIRKEIAYLKARPWNVFIESVKVVSVNDQPLTISVYIPVEEGKENELSISWSIWNETGQKDEFTLKGNSITVSDQRRIDGKRHIKIDLNDRGNRNIGYYTMSVLCKTSDMEISGEARIIITPDECYMPPELEQGKAWGLSTNLYSIRSNRNWGVGDFADLKRTVEWTAGLKGGFVGINPLHAIPNKKPFGISPYSPISRLYKNFLYLDMENIPEVNELTVNDNEIRDSLNELKKDDLIDYEKTALLKENILRSAFKSFHENHYKQDSQRGMAFKNYMAQEGDELESFSTYMALASLITHNPPLFSWQEWPEEYRNPSSIEVQEFRKTYKKLIMFHSYVQWLIDGQFMGVSEHAKNLGMSIGIYHDLAIGSIGGGSDAWMAQNIIADGTDLGAPPDDFNPNGQNWGFPPLIPEKLKESGYGYFIQTIGKNMKHCGALRIDHALGMFRQFWIPKDMPASKGAYVKLPAEDLLRIIALESVRNKTMVIAEDLGTVGENVREKLSRFGMLSYRLLYFERNYPDPSFTTPEKYPDTALCTVTTHDLPTIYGWWSGRDIEEKKRLGMYPDEGVWLRNICDRERDKELLINALRSEGILPHGSELFTSKPMSPELCLAIYEFLARTPCKLTAVSLDDIIGTPDQQNMPGITDSYPSWMQKTPVALEQMITDIRFSHLSEIFKRSGR